MYCFVYTKTLRDITDAPKRPWLVTPALNNLTISKCEVIYTLNLILFHFSNFHTCAHLWDPQNSIGNFSKLVVTPKYL